MNRALGVLTAGVIFSSGNVLAEDKIALTNDFSRSFLAKYAQSLEGGKRAFPRKFEFPANARPDSTFGIDVSHYQGAIDWSKVSGQSVQFVFIKATQGASGYDPMFKKNWEGVLSVKNVQNKIQRGAYHFLTANNPAVAQARNFLTTVGQLATEDIAPCVDVEWDFSKNSDGQVVDRWAKLKPEEIVSVIKLWINEVEKSTGRRPIIYTNAEWWKSRIGSNHGLDNYKVWIADYTSKSLGRESPVVPPNFNWLMWQITDRGVIKVAGLTNGLDISVIKSGETDLTGIIKK